jgi:hypothetical protein
VQAELDDVRLQRFQYVGSAVFGMDIQVDGLGQIQAEDTHDGLGVDHVSAGYQIKVIIKPGDIVYKGFYFVD